ncbi:MAG TPA: signal peptidase I [Candidatus Gastranaerophilales bacterium]|nr:signal peptidase I [Candidatus Gastranaerophilales bacterium]
MNTNKKAPDEIKFDKDKIKAFIKESVETIVIVLVLVIAIRSLLGEPRWIPTSSMEPTLQIKDNLIVEKVSYRFSKPQRGDILVFYPPNHELDPTLLGKFGRMIGFFSKDEAYIKRVIGLPGDLIEVAPNEGVYINGTLVNEPYVKEVFNGTCDVFMICGPYKIPQGNYYMMGDNRNDSTDSRYWGTLPEKRIVGKAFVKFWPPTRMGLIKRPEYNIKDK